MRFKWIIFYYLFSEQAVLFLSRYNPLDSLNPLNSANKAMVISFDGEVDDDIEFEYIDNINMGNAGCPATINGEFFMFGGQFQKTKVSLFHPSDNFYNNL